MFFDCRFSTFYNQQIHFSKNSEHCKITAKADQVATIIFSKFISLYNLLPYLIAQTNDKVCSGTNMRNLAHSLQSIITQNQYKVQKPLLWITLNPILPKISYRNWLCNCSPKDRKSQQNERLST